MKKFQKAFLLFLCAIFLATPISAHSGRTDASGGHKDNNNVSGLGPYHYHHGYEAHLHPGGVCPFDTGVGITNIDDSSSNSGNNYSPSIDAPHITREEFDKILSGEDYQPSISRERFNEILGISSDNDRPTVYLDNPVPQDPLEIAEEFQENFDSTYGKWYNDGYAKGKATGYEDGISRGEEIATNVFTPKLQKAEKTIQNQQSGICALVIVAVVAICSAIRSKKKLARMLSKQEGDQDAVS